MKNKLLWGLSALPTLITLVAVQFMEDRIPGHYDAMGNIDRWGSKYESFILPALILVFALFWWLMIRYYGKKRAAASDEKTAKEAALNETVLYYVGIGTTVFFTIMHCVLLYAALTEAKSNAATMSIDINMLINILMGIFIIVIGNMMPKCKRNALIGLRTVWSMENDEIWAKSNRFGGISFMISGLLIIIVSALVGGIWSTILMLGILVLDAVISVIYSYRVYQKSVERKG